MAFVPAPGQAHELPHAVALLEQLPGVPGRVAADLATIALKERRAVATRHEKTANSFMGVLCFAAAIDWIEC